MRFSDGSLAGQAAEIQIIQDPRIILQIYTNLVKSAKKEILLLLPTTSAFLREQKIGIIQSLHNAAKKGVQIRVLTPSDDRIAPEAKSIFRDEDANIEIRHLRKKTTTEKSEARTKILVVDNKEYLIVELKDDSKETFVDAVRLAIYSATPSTVKSYITMFDSLWEQSELYDQLEAHDRMQKEFINIAAHELRTPIQPIIGMTDLLASAFEYENEEAKITKDELQLLIRNANRLERLASDILEVSRIESNSLTLHKEKFDMNKKIENVVGEIKSLSNIDKDLEIIMLTGDPLFVDADKVRIFEVVSNLVRNAIKFTKEGTITVKAERKGSNVQVQVKDAGRGIDPEIMPRLFTKFATKSDQGTGLGLFISKMIIEAHGGTIWAGNNEDGKGATFSFTLPLA